MAPKKAVAKAAAPSPKSASKPKAKAGAVINLTTADNATSAKKTGSGKSKASSATPLEVAAAVVQGANPTNPQELFAILCDPEDPEIIAGDGICKLCELVGVDSQDRAALMLFWRLGAGSKPGLVTREEFLKGMTKIRKNTVQDLRAYIPHLDTGFLTYDEFREFYRFAHIFSREGTKKNLEKEMVIALLPLVLDDNRAPHLKTFLEFLASPESAEFTHISIDAWDSFYVFNKTVHPSLVDFDTDGSWPTILDTFVEWRQKKTPATSA